MDGGRWLLIGQCGESRDAATSPCKTNGEASRCSWVLMSAGAKASFWSSVSVQVSRLAALIGSTFASWICMHQLGSKLLFSPGLQLQFPSRKKKDWGWGQALSSERRASMERFAALPHLPAPYPYWADWGPLGVLAGCNSNGAADTGARYHILLPAYSQPLHE